jgi:hypothetical protein
VRLNFNHCFSPLPIPQTSGYCVLVLALVMPTPKPSCQERGGGGGVPIRKSKDPLNLRLKWAAKAHVTVFVCVLRKRSVVRKRRVCFDRHLIISSASRLRERFRLHALNPKLSCNQRPGSFSWVDSPHFNAILTGILIATLDRRQRSANLLSQ